MPLVVDASIAFKWFVPEIAGEQALNLFDRHPHLIAPDLVLVEVINAMWARLRGRENFPDAITDAANALPRIFDTLASSGELVPRALEMTIELKHPLYDCVYLALAERENSQLVTADTNFSNKVQASPFCELLAHIEQAGQ